jgi:hypothetical protein
MSPKHRFIQEPQGVTSQKALFFSRRRESLKSYMCYRPSGFSVHQTMEACLLQVSVFQVKFSESSSFLICEF